MPLRINPFLQVYFTESITPKDYIKLFSPVLIDSTLEIFQPGNIILEGTQGSGKSMLLALLKPEIRIAYHESDVDFPIPDEFARFIGAGISLIRCGAIDFGERMYSKSGDKIPDNQLVRYFGDFINYLIIDDILSSIQILSEASNGTLAKEIGINMNKKIMDDFTQDLIEKDCWFGFFDGVSTYKQYRELIKNRIKSYRSFLRGNILDLPPEIDGSITNPGEPISQTAISLWKTNVLKHDIPIYIRVDQCEEMQRLEAKAREKKLYMEFRKVTNKMMGVRDSNVSYRFGGRPYAFHDRKGKQMFGTTASIEDLRSVKIIDLDRELRRKENRKTWIYPKFARDVFRRRMECLGYKCPTSKKSLISHVLGGYRYSVREKINNYVGDDNDSKDILIIEDTWPDEIKKSLIKIAKDDPLSAKLGEAWVRQKIDRGELTPFNEVDLPWAKKKWWIKERTFHASLQIAAQRAQKLIWAKEKDVLDLSGGNILIFLTIFQHIWAAWLKTLPRDTDWGDNRLPIIDDPILHSVGIDEASDRWYEKIREETRGDTRRRTVAVFGLLFRNKLRGDKKMSYPGHNGISLTKNDLEDDEDVYRILKDASAFGVMIDIKHTPKTPSRGESQKWYLHPIFSPHFQIPAMHTKEPIYVNTKRIRKLLEKAKVIHKKNDRG